MKKLNEVFSEETIYVVHSDANENNILQDFDDLAAALKYAKDNIDELTYIEEVVKDSESDEIYSAEIIWSYDEDDAEDQVVCEWCHELAYESDCRKELNLGLICKDCQSALYSRGEKPVFEEAYDSDYAEGDDIFAQDFPEANFESKYSLEEPSKPKLNMGRLGKELEEGLNNKEHAELIQLCKEIGIEGTKDLQSFIKEVGLEPGCSAQDVLQALREYRAELGPDFKIIEAVNKKDDELPVDPEAAKLEVHTMLNNLVADEIEAINGYDDAKAQIIDTPIEHKDSILDTIDHIKDEEQEHIDELIDATTEIPFDKEEVSDFAVEEESLSEEINASVSLKELKSNIYDVINEHWETVFSDEYFHKDSFSLNQSTSDKNLLIVNFKPRKEVYFKRESDFEEFKNSLKTMPGLKLKKIHKKLVNVSFYDNAQFIKVDEIVFQLIEQIKEEAELSEGYKTDLSQITVKEIKEDLYLHGNIYFDLAEPIEESDEDGWRGANEIKIVEKEDGSYEGYYQWLDQDGDLIVSDADEYFDDFEELLYWLDDYLVNIVDLDEYIGSEIMEGLREAKKPECDNCDECDDCEPEGKTTEVIEVDSKVLEES